MKMTLFLISFTAFLLSALVYVSHCSTPTKHITRQTTRTVIWSGALTFVFFVATIAAIRWG